MKRIILIIYLLSIGFPAIYCNSTSPIPKLTQQEMYEDFDYFVQEIKNVYCRIDVKKEIMGVDILSEFAELRKEILNIKSTRGFLILMHRASQVLQEPHTWIVDPDKGIPWWAMQNSGQKIQNKSFYRRYLNMIPSVNLTIPVIYFNGEYRVYSDFSYKDAVIHRGDILTEINATPIHDYVESLISWKTLYWDQKHKRLYHHQFYNNPGFFNLKNHNLTFMTKQKKKKTISFNPKKGLDYKPVSFLPFGSKRHNNSQHGDVIYFARNKTLYLRLNSLVGDFRSVPIFIKKMNEIYSSSSVSKIVFDLRGCPGGNVYYFPYLMNLLLDHPIPMYETVGMKKIDDYILRATNTFTNQGKHRITALDDEEYYLISIKDNYLKMSDYNMGYKGKVYVLLDENGFSATTTLQRMASHWPSVITVGQPAGYEQGGAVGFYSEAVILPHSQIAIVYANGISMEKYEQISDLYDNKVELPVEWEWSEVLFRIHYNGSVFGKRFLLNHDPVMQSIFNLE